MPSNVFRKLLAFTITLLLMNSSGVVSAGFISSASNPYRYESSSSIHSQVFQQVNEPVHANNVELDSGKTAGISGDSSSKKVRQSLSKEQSEDPTRILNKQEKTLFPVNFASMPNPGCGRDDGDPIPGRDEVHRPGNQLPTDPFAKTGNGGVGGSNTGSNSGSNTLQGDLPSFEIGIVLDLCSKVVYDSEDILPEVLKWRYFRPPRV